MLQGLGAVYRRAGRNAEAQAILTEAADLLKKLGSTHIYGVALTELARLAITEGRWSDADRFMTEVLAEMAAREAEVTDESVRRHRSCTGPPIPMRPLPL